MNRFLSKYNKFSCFINNWLEKTCLVLLILMTIIVMLQVFFRYVLNLGGIVWAEEVAKMMMIWLALLGSSVALYENIHVSIEFIVDRIKYKRAIKIMHHLLAIIFSGFLMVSGYHFAIFGFRIISPATGIQKFWAHLAILVGAILMLIQGTNHLLNEIFGSSKKQSEDLMPEDHSGSQAREKGL